MWLVKALPPLHLCFINKQKHMKTIATALILTVSLLNANATTATQLLHKSHAVKTQQRRASRIKVSHDNEKTTSPAVNTNVLYGRF
jgi:hypothetical protein